MGAKTPTKLKLRRPTYKCDVCNKKFLSVQAVKTHQQYSHKLKSVAKPKEKSKLKTLLGKPVRKQEDAEAKSSVETKMPEQKKVTAAENVPPLASDARRIEFECPQCPVMYSVYFAALRHIQKSHCVNIMGEKVAPNARDLIKPIRVEICVKCNKKITRTEPHLCFEKTLDPKLYYICTGCKQKFSSIQHFDFHVTGLHCDDIESMFFSTMKEFTSWKQDLESQLGIEYLVLGKCPSKQTYHCTHPFDKEDENMAYLCPSNLGVREYSKGIQVHFYKQHYGHESKTYKLPIRYTKYCITSLMKNITTYIDHSIAEQDEKDLYVQFKTLMNSIVMDAAKVNIHNLKLLIGKALEMTTILKSFDEEDESAPKQSHHKIMSDAEISKALESFQSSRTKRRMSTPVNEVKKPKVSAPIIVNTFSMAKENEQKDSQPIKETEQPPVVKAIQSPITKVTQSPVAKVAQSPVAKATQSPSSVCSFNDSYKDFVDKKFKAGETKLNESINSRLRSNKEKADEKDNATSTASSQSGEAKKHNNKKKVVKTKIGQFKPSLSPKKTEKVTGVQQRKVDFEYEVKERENDCNILILKI